MVLKFLVLGAISFIVFGQAGLCWAAGIYIFSILFIWLSADRLILKFLGAKIVSKHSNLYGVIKAIYYKEGFSSIEFYEVKESFPNIILLDSIFMGKSIVMMGGIEKKMAQSDFEEKIQICAQIHRHEGIKLNIIASFFMYLIKSLGKTFKFRPLIPFYYIFSSYMVPFEWLKNNIIKRRLSNSDKLNLKFPIGIKSSSRKNINDLLRDIVIFPDSEKKSWNLLDLKI